MQSMEEDEETKLLNGATLASPFAARSMLPPSIRRLFRNFKALLAL